MNTLQITKELAQIPIQKNKIYQTTYDEDGYEIGFGRAGNYKGHSHIHFYDIIYTPNGFIIKDLHNSPLSGKLLVVPPRTWLSDITLNDFFFIKFCGESGLISVPDKVDYFQNESNLIILNSYESISLPWYSSPFGEKSYIKFELIENSFIITFDNKNKLQII